MPLLRITTRYDRLSDADLTEKATFICQQLSNNADVFVDPDPSPDDLRNLIKAFTKKKAVADDGSRSAIAEKNRLRRDLVEMLYLVGYYVLYVAKGNRNVVKLAGLDLMKEATPTQLTVPSMPVLVAGPQRGWLEVTVNVVEGAKSYLHQYSTNPALPDESWTTKSGTTACRMLKGLVPGTLYHVRVGVIGANDQVLFSDVVSRVAA